jgi:hypothetical protein
VALDPLPVDVFDASGAALGGALVELRRKRTGAPAVFLTEDGHPHPSPYTNDRGRFEGYLTNGLYQWRGVFEQPGQPTFYTDWTTYRAISPVGVEGQWSGDGGVIVAGVPSDFPITVPELGVEKVPWSAWVSVDFAHPNKADLDLLLHQAGAPAGAGNPPFRVLTHGMLTVPGAWDGELSWESFVMNAEPARYLGNGSGLYLTASMADDADAIGVQNSPLHPGDDWVLPVYARVSNEQQWWTWDSSTPSEVIKIVGLRASDDPSEVIWDIERGQFGTTPMAGDPAGVTILFTLADYRSSTLADLGGATSINTANAEGDWILRVVNHGDQEGTVRGLQLVFPERVSF